MWFEIDDVLGEVITHSSLRTGEWLPTFSMGSIEQMFSMDI